jgi:hypothetical protein
MDALYFVQTLISGLRLPNFILNRVKFFNELPTFDYKIRLVKNKIFSVFPQNQNLNKIFKNLLFFCFALFSGVLHAQISDDFSDGNFTQNPGWQGDSANFIVNSAGALQLLAPAAGSSQLVVQGYIPDSAVWMLDIRLAFAPSASNILRIYLVADQANLATAGGYLLEIGENGSLDALRFFRQDASVRSLLAAGPAGAVAGEPVDIRLRVRRSAAGDWTAEIAAPGEVFKGQFSVRDTAYLPGPDRFFGLQCLYTATRTDKFFFDNLTILPDLPDAQPPVLQQVVAADAQTLRILFDEALSPGEATLRANYHISGLGAPDSVVLQADQRTVLLLLATPLSTGNYLLECTGLADTLGNMGGLQTAAFSYTRIEAPGEFDILLNEIMADPSPSASLPEVEWLELYNRSGKIFQLDQLTLSDGGALLPLPGGLLYPGGYVVLSASAGAGALAAAAPNVLAMSAFPGLNNEGEQLVLRAADGRVIDQVSYDLDWHAAADKRLGGWSLERINPSAPCLGNINWTSCPVLPGGTPGVQNAAFLDTPDLDSPRLLSAFPLDEQTLSLQFSEGLDAVAAADPTAYRIEPPLAILNAAPVAGNRAAVLLTLGASLQRGQVYRISALPQLVDCSGNPAGTQDTVLAGVPETPAARDIVINEVLFNPVSGGARYLECYNRSNRIFDWRNFFVANFFEGAEIEPVGFQRLFLPGQYIVLTENPADILRRYSDVRAEWVLQANLPTLDDDEGNVTLYWSDGSQTVTLDSVQYLAEWHNPFFSGADREGVSLERIRPDGPTNEPGNWTSAAALAGGPAGSPTRPNSQSQQVSASDEEILALLRDRLSPDGDGYEDFLELQYRLPGSGFAATVVVYDAAGAPVRRIVRQALTGSAGVLRWDGEAEDGQRVRPGIYVVYAEFFEPEGRVYRVKKPVAVVKRF